MRELKQRGASPFLDDPVWRLEIDSAGQAAERFEVLGAEEERVGELVFVDEEVGRESQMGVELA